jgi:DNA uptake protein ComE-like DNA-binding protein
MLDFPSSEGPEAAVTIARSRLGSRRSVPIRGRTGWTGAWEPARGRVRSRYSGPVPRPGKKTAQSADEWLLNGADREPGDPEDLLQEGPPSGSIGSETSQWLAVPAAEPNGRKETAPGISPTQDEKSAVPTKALQEQEAKNADLAKARRNREAEFKQESKSAEADVKARLDQQKEELTKGFEKRETELRAQIERLESEIADAKKPSRQRRKAPAKPAKTRRSSRKSGTLPLNEATFEELRGLGLSVTQSARVIAYRDVRGGFESLDELDEIPGLPKETRADLRQRLILQG